MNGDRKIFRLQQASFTKKRKPEDTAFYCHVCCTGFGMWGGVKKHFIARPAHAKGRTGRVKTLEDMIPPLAEGSGGGG